MSQEPLGLFRCLTLGSRHRLSASCLPVSLAAVAGYVTGFLAVIADRLADLCPSIGWKGAVLGCIPGRACPPTGWGPASLPDVAFSLLFSAPGTFFSLALASALDSLALSCSNCFYNLVIEWVCLIVPSIHHVEFHRLLPTHCQHLLHLLSFSFQL